MRVKGEDVDTDPILHEALGLTSGRFQFGFHMQVFNPYMRFARKSIGMTQRELSLEVGVSETFISLIERLRRFPKIKLAEAIAEVLHRSREELFPDWLEFYVVGRDIEFVMTVDQIEAAFRVGPKITWPALLCSEEFPENEPGVRIEILERNELLTQMISSLPLRQQRVLALRFEEGLTLEEIGAKHLTLTRERVRQLEFQALRSLLGYKKSDLLREYPR